MVGTFLSATRRSNPRGENERPRGSEQAEGMSEVSKSDSNEMPKRSGQPRLN